MKYWHMLRYTTASTTLFQVKEQTQKTTCMCVSHSSHVQLFATPWTIAHQSPLSVEFSRQEYWSGLPFPSPRQSSQFRDWTQVSCIAGRFFTIFTREASNIHIIWFSIQFSHSVVSNSLRPHGCQASLSLTNSWSLLKLMPIESVMPSNHLILCHPLLLWPSIFPSIRVFSIESVLCIRWPKYWSFSFSISPSNDYLGLISFRII